MRGLGFRGVRVEASSALKVTSWRPKGEGKKRRREAAAVMDRFNLGGSVMRAAGCSSTQTVGTDR